MGGGALDAPLELGLEQRLEALEGSVQRMAGAALRKLLDANLPPREAVAVVADPEIGPFEGLGRPVAYVPPEAEGSAAGVARLEARHVQGVRFVLVPEAAGEEVRQDTHLAEHLRTHFRAIASDPEVGTVFEAATAPAAGEPEVPELGAVIDSLCLDDRLAPLLDWTSLELARLLPERTLFRPVEPAAPALPYLPQTIEVVFVDDASRMDEAARVAAGTAVLVATDAAGRAIAAETRHIRSASGPAPEPVLIVVPADADNEWVGRLAEAVALRPGVEVLGATDPIAAAAESAAATVVVAEHGVLPLPRCIEAAERILEVHDDVGGVAVKLFGADGSLEAAGAAAFADGSVEAIASGGPPAGAWHEYVRPVAAAVGLVVLRSKALRECADACEGAVDLTGLSAQLWSNGWELRYQPDAAAVRVLAPAETGGRRIWPQAPDGLPARPRELDDASWRRLLANDEVGAVR